jgi:hypothetical protein
MLISMPTGTSTILGVFQAILALLVKPDELRPPPKIVANENFASEIFCHKPLFLCCNATRFSQFCAFLGQNFVRPWGETKLDQHVQSASGPWHPAAVRSGVAKGPAATCRRGPAEAVNGSGI